MGYLDSTALAGNLFFKNHLNLIKTLGATLLVRRGVELRQLLEEVEG
ncbi:hypothetical protein RintRC_0471 [Richelia intracellularis]|nr:hypothetical protein RintRC_0471 [Richelia intracellularis]